MRIRLRSTVSRWLAFAAVAALCTACAGESLGYTADSAEGTDSVKVGLLVAKSGVYSSVGRDMENGLELYLEQHGNTVGGRKVELVTVDEGESAQSGVSGATRLVQQEQVDVVLGVTSGPTATGSRDIFDASQVPVLMGNTGAVAFGKELASDWIWRASYDNGQPGRALGKQLAQDSSAGKVFLIASDYSGGHETLAGFKETFPAERIAGELYTPYGSTSDFSSYLSQIRASGSDSVFTFYAGSEAIEFTKQYHQFGLGRTSDLYSAGFLTEGSALDAEGEAALGVLNSTRYNWDLDNPQNARFAPAYEREYGVVPTVYAATMYDIGVLLDSAVSTIDGDASRESINDALGTLGTVDGVRGELRFDQTQTVLQEFHLTEVRRTDEGLRNVTLETLPRP